jgi:hypothetical protein
MKFKYFIPLLTWLIPTIIISIVMFQTEPLTKIQYYGFTALIISSCLTYFTGLKLALKDKEGK